MLQITTSITPLNDVNVRSGTCLQYYTSNTFSIQTSQRVSIDTSKYRYRQMFYRPREILYFQKTINRHENITNAGICACVLIDISQPVYISCTADYNQHRWLVRVKHLLLNLCSPQSTIFHQVGNFINTITYKLYV